MRALIVNNYTPRNLGDAAIVEGLIFSLRRSGYTHVTIAAIYPEDDWGQVGADAAIPSLFRVGHGSRFSQVGRLAASIVRAILGFAAPSRLAAVRGYRDADLVVAAGGGYLGAGRVLTNLLAGLNIAYGRWLGKRTVAAPMSIRPCSRVVAFILRRTLGGTPIFARDRLSQRIFADAGIAAGLSSDLALRAPSLAKTTRTSDGRTIGWAPRTYARDHHTAWSDEAAVDELRQLMRDGYRVVLLTQCTAPSADDRPAVERVARMLGEATALPVAGTLKEAQAQWAGVDVLIGGRMHAAIGAMRSGTPALAVAYEEKVTGMFEDLGLPHAVESAHGLAASVASLIGTKPILKGDWEAFDAAIAAPDRLAQPRRTWQ